MPPLSIHSTQKQAMLPKKAFSQKDQPAVSLSGFHSNKVAQHLPLWVSIATSAAFGLLTVGVGNGGAESSSLIPRVLDTERLLLPAKMKIPTRIRKTRR